MAKITRKTAKIFAGSASAAPLGIAQFGSLAAAALAYSTDPDVIQALGAWEAGWNDAILTKKNPTLEDMNAVCFVLARQVAYLLQQGIGEYDASTTYYTYSFCSYNGALYRSLADDNTGNLPTDIDYWAMVCGLNNSVPSYSIDCDLSAGGPFDDYAPTGACPSAGILRFIGTPAGAVNITGFDSDVLAYYGRPLYLVNYCGQDVVLDLTNTGNSSILNRLDFSTGADITLAHGGVIQLMWAEGRWRNVQ